MDANRADRIFGILATPAAPSTESFASRHRRYEAAAHALAEVQSPDDSVVEASARVLRELSDRHASMSLSFGERQMFRAMRSLFAKAIATATGQSVDEVDAHIGAALQAG